jgi:hypothetical protein
MDMSDTPETDAALYPMNGVDIVWPDFARKLERERDEARESLKHITEYGTEEINAAVELRQKLASALVKYDALATEHMLVVNKLCKERDDARDALSRIDEIFCDGEDTHDDWMKMGNIAKNYFKGLE